MKAADLTHLLAELRIPVRDLAELIQQPEDWCIQLITGRQPVPYWLELLTMYWAHAPKTLEIACNLADPPACGGIGAAGSLSGGFNSIARREPVYSAPLGSD
jgi:hypothetical protein